MTYYNNNFTLYEKEVMRLIGIKVKKYLDENGIKYSYLSEKIGMPMNTLSLLLNGKRKMSVEEYFMICEVLELPVNTFEPNGEEEAG